MAHNTMFLARRDVNSGELFVDWRIQWDRDALKAETVLARVRSKSMPVEAMQIASTAEHMDLRARYNSDIVGPYLVVTEEPFEHLDEWVKNQSVSELEKYQLKG